LITNEKSACAASDTVAPMAEYQGDVENRVQIFGGKLASDWNKSKFAPTAR
jgi:hypothetical protein